MGLMGLLLSEMLLCSGALEWFINTAKTVSEALMRWLFHAGIICCEHLARMITLLTYSATVALEINNQHALTSAYYALMASIKKLDVRIENRHRPLQRALDIPSLSRRTQKSSMICGCRQYETLRTLCNGTAGIDQALPSILVRSLRTR